MLVRPPLAAAALAACLLLTTACGGNDGGGAGGSKGGAAAKASASAAHDLPTAQRLLDRTEKRIEDAGAGGFGQTITDGQGRVVTALTGTYSLDAEQARATLRIPDGVAKGTDARAEVLESKGRAWVRTSQYTGKQAGCYLATTPRELLDSFGVDVASAGDSVPLALRLIGAFKASSTTGGGVLQGTVPLLEVAPLLPASLVGQVRQAKPKVDVAATVGISGDEVTVSIGGFSLVGPIAGALGVEEAQLGDLGTLHFDATLTPLAKRFVTVVAPPARKQMTQAQVSAGTCG